MATKPKKVKRDPNKPVLSFTVHTGKMADSPRTRYDVLICGPDETVLSAANPKYRCGPNSLIVRETSPHRHYEGEHDLFDPKTWGYFGRLMAENHEIELHTPTDKEILHGPNC